MLSEEASRSIPAPLAEPTRTVTAGWLAAFAVAWLGVWMAQLSPFQLLLPAQVEGALGRTDWQDSVIAFGIISGISGLCAMLAFPLTGALSDRTTSRFGRRRPWVAGGALLFAVSLVALGTQTGLLGLGVCWCAAIVGFCVLSAALTATISDRVPVGQRGIASAMVSAPQALGTVLGVVLVGLLITGVLLGYTVLAVLLLVLLIPFLRLPDAVLPRADRPPVTAAAFVEGLWISPRRHPDFAWTLAGRVLVNVGNALGTGLLLYFLEFGLRMRDAEDALVLLTLVYTVFVMVAALAMGRASDRIGRRRPFVAIASVLLAVAALVLAVVPSYPAALVAAALLGLGFGAFLAVDQALATQVLPDPRDRGKDLGIMNIAFAVPQAVAPLLGALVVTALGGFTGLFVLSAVAALLGAACVLRVRSVR